MEEEETTAPIKTTTTTTTTTKEDSSSSFSKLKNFEGEEEEEEEEEEKKKKEIPLKLKFKTWQGVATWTWNDASDVCGICHSPYDGCAPDCKYPGDDSPVVWGVCSHAFHLHCLRSWLERQQALGFYRGVPDWGIAKLQRFTIFVSPPRAHCTSFLLLERMHLLLQMQ